MSIKTGYFTKRNADLTNDDRYSFGQREIQTIQNLLAHFYHYDLHTTPRRILDCGCGDKFLQSPLEEKGHTYAGLDIEDLNFESDPFPLDDASYDLVISLAVIEHLTDPSSFLGEIHRVLKPGGYVFLSTPNWQYSMRDFYNDVTHVKPYTPASLESALRYYHFEKVRSFPGLRCKSAKWYKGDMRFAKARYLLPFTNQHKLIPSFLKGKARSIFAIGCKGATKST